MGEHLSSHWALKITATAGSDLNLVEKAALKAYEKANLLKPGLVARVSHLEIVNRETGQSGSYAFVGIGMGFGAGIVSVDLRDKWHPFETKQPITLEEFSNHAAILYNMSAGVGFNWAPISGIRFDGIDIHQNSNGKHFGTGTGSAWAVSPRLTQGPPWTFPKLVGGFLQSTKKRATNRLFSTSMR